ncbi:MAG: XRE family transcriptional regulator [Candidatus Nanopelagicaceae bacterium]|jgi:transcriptional regulator with XRE-family HTH domain
MSKKRESEWVSWEEFREEFQVDPKRLKRGVQKILAKLDGVKLAELRQVKRLTQAQMAKKLKIDQSNVSRIERGSFDPIEIRTLRRYVEALGGELEIRVKIDETSQRLIDSEYEKKLERRLKMTEQGRTSTARSKSVAKRRITKKVQKRVSAKATLRRKA